MAWAQEVCDRWIKIQRYTAVLFIGHRGRRQWLLSLRSQAAHVIHKSVDHWGQGSCLRASGFHVSDPSKTFDALLGADPFVNKTRSPDEALLQRAGHRSVRPGGWGRWGEGQEAQSLPKLGLVRVSHAGVSKFVGTVTWNVAQRNVTHFRSLRARLRETM